MTQKKKRTSLSGKRYQLDVLQPPHFTRSGTSSCAFAGTYGIFGIYSNNLDEFFRVRMATQNRIAECTDKSTSRESEHAKS